MKRVLTVFFLLFLLSGAFAAEGAATVEKWSGNAVLPVNPAEEDGLVNDPENSYAWSMAEYGDYLYVGTNRNYLKQIFSNFGGSIPIDIFPESKDKKAKIYRKLVNGKGDWELFYESPMVDITLDGTPGSVVLDNGYRGMTVWEGALYIVTYSFFESPYSRVLRLADPAGTGADLEEVLRVENHGGSGLRAVIDYEGALFIGTEDLNLWKASAPAAQLAVTTPIAMAMVSAGPVNIPVTIDELGGKDGWTKVADKTSFPGVTPPVEAAGWGGIWDFAVYNESLYISIADPGHGFSVYKSDGTLRDAGTSAKGTAEELWVWTPIVADKTLNPGALYDQGLGTRQNAAVSMVFFDGKMYAGTFSSWSDVLNALMSRSQEEALQKIALMLANWTPPQVYRFDEDDVWEMVVGDVGKLPGFDTRTSTWRAGFFPSADPAVPNLSTNRYIWRMQVHDGHLFMGTMDMLPILKIIANALEGTDYGPAIKQLFDYLESGAAGNPAGFDLYMTENGKDIEIVTRDGGFGEIFGKTASGDVGDFYNYGARTLVSSDGLLIGTANPFKGCQVWKLTMPEPTPSGSGGGCSSQNTGIFALMLLLPLAFVAVKKGR